MRTAEFLDFFNGPILGAVINNHDFEGDTNIAASRGDRFQSRQNVFLLLVACHKKSQLKGFLRFWLGRLRTKGNNFGEAALHW